MSEMHKEFIQEANELIDLAEDALINIEKESEFDQSYHQFFRSLNSLKGGAGMLGMEKVKEHVQRLESLVQTQVKGTPFKGDLVDYFFKGLDLTRKMLEGHEEDFPDFSPGENAPVIEEVNTDSAPTRSESFKETVWLVDDEEELLCLMDMLLGSVGYKVVCFSNPLEAVERLETENPSLLISDYNMPQMNGFELMQKARNIRPHIPFMVISAYLDIDKTIAFHQAGVDGIFKKPLDNDFFLSLVKKSVSRYRALKLLDKSIHLITYYFSDLVQLSEQAGKSSAVNGLKDELKQLYFAKKLLDES